MQNLILGMFMLGIFFVLFYCPFSITKGITKIAYKEFRVKDVLLAVVPVLNICVAEKRYKGKIGFTAYATIVTFLLLIIRLITVFAAPAGSLVIYITSYLTIAAIILLYIANAALVFIVLHDANTNPLWQIITFSVLYPIGMYYIGTYLPGVMRQFENEVNTFK